MRYALFKSDCSINNRIRYNGFPADITLDFEVFDGTLSDDGLVAIITTINLTYNYAVTSDTNGYNKKGYMLAGYEKVGKLYRCTFIFDPFYSEITKLWGKQIPVERTPTAIDALGYDDPLMNIQAKNIELNTLFSTATSGNIDFMVIHSRTATMTGWAVAPWRLRNSKGEIINEIPELYQCIITSEVINNPDVGWEHILNRLGGNVNILAIIPIFIRPDYSERGALGFSEFVDTYGEAEYVVYTANAGCITYRINQLEITNHGAAMIPLGADILTIPAPFLNAAYRDNDYKTWRPILKFVPTLSGSMYCLGYSSPSFYEVFKGASEFNNSMPLITSAYADWWKQNSLADKQKDLQIQNMYMQALFSMVGVGSTASINSAANSARQNTRISMQDAINQTMGTNNGDAINSLREEGRNLNDPSYDSWAARAVSRYNAGVKSSSQIAKLNLIGAGVQAGSIAAGAVWNHYATERAWSLQQQNLLAQNPIIKSLNSSSLITGLFNNYTQIKYCYLYDLNDRAGWEKFYSRVGYQASGHLFTIDENTRGAIVTGNLIPYVDDLVGVPFTTALYEELQRGVLLGGSTELTKLPAPVIKEEITQL